MNNSNQKQQNIFGKLDLTYFASEGSALSKKNKIFRDE